MIIETLMAFQFTDKSRMTKIKITFNDLLSHHTREKQGSARFHIWIVSTKMIYFEHFAIYSNL